jgi:hypothetical protein
VRPHEHGLTDPAAEQPDLAHRATTKLSLCTTPQSPGEASREVGKELVAVPAASTDKHHLRFRVSNSARAICRSHLVTGLGGGEVPDVPAAGASVLGIPFGFSSTAEFEVF